MQQSSIFFSLHVANSYFSMYHKINNLYHMNFFQKFFSAKAWHMNTNKNKDIVLHLRTVHTPLFGIYNMCTLTHLDLFCQILICLFECVDFFKKSVDSCRMLRKLTILRHWHRSRCAHSFDTSLILLRIGAGLFFATHFP